LTILFANNVQTGKLSVNNDMIKNFEHISSVDLIKEPFFYNHLIKSTSNRFLDKFLSFVETDELILDMGCGRDSVIPSCYKKIEVDFLCQNRPHVVGDAGNIPFKDSSVDHLCCSWMFEHIEEPAHTLSEFYRVLKFGGYLYLTTNFVWHLHEAPRDFFRFTRYGLNYLFNNYGKWKIIFLKPTAGYWLTMLQLLNYKFAKILGPIHPVVTIPLQLTGLLLEKLNFDDSIAAGYCIIAQKL